MKYLIFVFFILGASEVRAENYNYLELSQGVKVNGMPWGDSNWSGSCPTAVSIGKHWDYGKATYFRAQFNHTSNICKGAPFRKVESETWLDQVNVTIGFKF